MVGPDLLAVEAAAARARESLASRGYLPINTPILESSELFLRKSGGVLSSQMYDFVAPDGSSLCLRPEITAPVIRYALETQPDSTVTQRFQYAGPVFRYPDGLAGSDPGEAGPLRQFTQVGAELIGPSTPSSDGEILAAAIEAANAVGLRDITIAIGDVGLVRSLLAQFGLSKRVELFLVSHLGQLADGNEFADIRERAEGIRPSVMNEKFGDSRFVSDVIDLAVGGLNSHTRSDSGRRNSSEIVSGIQQISMRHDAHRSFPDAFDFLASLASISGECEEALNSVAELCATHNLKYEDAVDRARDVVSAAVQEGVDAGRLTVNFGIEVGIAYYTGLVFEIGARTESGSTSKVGGGGRYDGLATALGSPSPVPALGFALNLEHMVSLASGGDGVPQAIGAAETVQL